MGISNDKQGRDLMRKMVQERAPEFSAHEDASFFNKNTQINQVCEVIV